MVATPAPSARIKEPVLQPVRLVKSWFTRATHHCLTQRKPISPDLKVGGLHQRWEPRCRQGG